MPTGRKPRPLKLVDNGKNRHTKDTMENRENGEPTGCSDKLKPPKSLSPEAKKEWKRVVKLYRQLDTPIINDLDISALAAYCESVAIYQKPRRNTKTARLYTGRRTASQRKTHISPSCAGRGRIS